MQANEAIEKLREAAQVVVRQALDDVEVHPCDVHNDIVRASGLTEPVRSLYAALAATATIAPPAVNLPDTSQEWAKLDGATAWHLIERHADNWSEIGSMMESWLAARSAAAPVLAAVGVEQQQQQQQQGNATRPSAEPAGQHRSAGMVAWAARNCEGWDLIDDSRELVNDHINDLLQTDVGRDMSPWSLHRLVVTPEVSAPVPRVGGNTIPEVPAAQPAADHAKHDGCCNNNCNQGRECPERK